MKCRLLDLAVSLSGKQRLTIEIDEDFRETFDKLKEKELDLTLKRWHPKRSLQANAYAWALIDKIAEKNHKTKTEVYKNAIRDIGGVSTVVCVKNIAVEDLKRTWTAFGTGWQVEDVDDHVPGWTNVCLYKGSSVYDTAQMAALIDALIQDAQSIGIETRPKEEIESLLKEYEKRC